MAKVKLDDWIKYLESRVDIDLYVWGANGESLIDLLPKICDMETSEKNVDRILTLLQKRLKDNINIHQIRCEDCSGLGVRYLLEKSVISSDVTADGFYKMIKEKVNMKDVKAGDFLFMGTEEKKTHVGYAVSDIYAIESKGRDDGVVVTKISDRGWGWAKRPDWYSDTPEPEKPILDRELYLTNPYMRGDDVEDAQMLLTAKKYNPGSIDGIFGKKTEIATKNFQSDNNLTVDGIIGKRTADKLGFEWVGD